MVSLKEHIQIFKNITKEVRLNIPILRMIWHIAQEHSHELEANTVENKDAVDIFLDHVLPKVTRK